MIAASGHFWAWGVMMIFKVLSVAVLAALSLPMAGEARTVAQVGAPAELPPASFKGQQYVDSRGCVFLRAGFDGRVNWVPRVGRDRKAICTAQPTFGPRPAIEVAADEAPEVVAPQVVAPRVVAPVARTPVVRTQVGAPLATIASLPAARVVAPRVVAPRVAAAPAPVAPVGVVAPGSRYEVVPSAGGSGRQIGCYTSAPVAERVRLRTGGSVVVCTRGDGTLTGWRPPIYPAGAGVGAALSDQVVARGTSSGATVAAGGYAQAEVVIPKPPKGYKLAWTDDRLNPQRGQGTAEGWAAQDQVWTRDVPAVLVADQRKVKKRKAAKAGGVTVSTKSVATAPVVARSKAVAGGVLVQVGTFGVAANAAGAGARLQALGLPVAKARISREGRDLQIVYAGPFGSVAEAQRAVAAARGAGFADAFIR